MIRWLLGLPTHNLKSGGCRWFRGSFDTLSETCSVCE